VRAERRTEPLGPVRSLCSHPTGLGNTVCMHAIIMCLRGSESGPRLRWVFTSSTSMILKSRCILQSHVPVKLCFCARATPICRCPRGCRPRLSSTPRSPHTYSLMTYMPRQRCRLASCVWKQLPSSAAPKHARATWHVAHDGPPGHAAPYTPSLCRARPYMQAPGSSPKRAGLRGAWGDTPCEQQDRRAARARPRAAAAGRPAGAPRPRARGSHSAHAAVGRDHVRAAGVVHAAAPAAEQAAAQAAPGRRP